MNQADHVVAWYGMEIPGMTLRPIKQGEETGLLQVLAETYGGFHDLPGTRLVLSSQRFGPNSCFIAEEYGSLTGCVAVTKLPRNRWFVIRYLAVKEARSRVEVVEKLLEKAVQYAKSESPEFLRATTPAIEPYVKVYRGSGFRPVRRDFRMSWDLEAHESVRSDFEIRELHAHLVGEAAESYVESLRPYWDWRTEEQGGPGAVANSFKESVRQGERWLLCRVGERIVGLAGLIPDFYGTGRARFRGASVLPDYRGKGIGSALMLETMNFAKKLGQRGMIVYTFSYLDCLAPGAMLYLRSGGRIEAEFLQLQM